MSFKHKEQKQFLNYYHCILQLPFLHLNVPYICVSRCSRRWDHMQIAGALQSFFSTEKVLAGILEGSI